MKYQVPQFIDIEDKPIGNFLSLKQFIYLAGGLGLAWLSYRFIGMISVLLSLPFVILFATLGALLAFGKVNERPFPLMLEAMVRFWSANKLYIWKKKDRVIQPGRHLDATDPISSLTVPKLSDSRLRDLNWMLDASKDAPDFKK